MTRFTGPSALALLASLGACGGAAQPAPEPTAGAEMKMDGPFATSEMAMDTAMRSAVGVDAADTWVKKMIAHHQGAIDMSRTVLDLRPTPDVAKMAQMTIANQGAEIDALKALSKTGAPDTQSAALYETAIAKMHQDMMAATGTTASETYLAKMLAHHRGAVAMSDIALANGAAGAVRAQIEKTRAQQLKEIAMVEALLRGDPIGRQARTSDASAPRPAAQPAVAATSAAKAAPTRAAPAKSAAATASPEPAAKPEAPQSCAPEHRAAGHC